MRKERAYRLVLGSAQLAQRYGVLGSVLEPGLPVSAFLDAAKQMGFSAIDTAPVYGDSERLVGETRTDLTIFTKLGPNFPVRESLKRSLASLNVEFIEVIFFHQKLDQVEDLARSLAELGEFRGEYIGAVGASIYSLEELEYVLTLPEVTVIQAPLSVLDRRFRSTVLQRVVDSGRRFFARSVLLQGAQLDTVPCNTGEVSPLVH